MMKITNAELADLSAIVAIEQACFSPAEAGSAAAFRERITKLQSTFLVAKEGNQIVGFIVGPASPAEFVEDWMYEKTPNNLASGGHQLVLSLAVAPQWRHRGIGGQLLAALAAVARQAHRETISLDSLAKNVPFYEQNGFTKVGISASSHAGETWFNLVKEL